MQKHATLLIGVTILLALIVFAAFFIVQKFATPSSGAHSILQPSVPASALTSSDSPIARDATHVWFKGNIVEGADPATFVLIPTQNSSDKVYGRDRYYVYVQSTDGTTLALIPGADPKTFVAP